MPPLAQPLLLRLRRRILVPGILRKLGVASGTLSAFSRRDCDRGHYFEFNLGACMLFANDDRTLKSPGALVTLFPDFFSTQATIGDGTDQEGREDVTGNGDKKRKPLMDHARVLGPAAAARKKLPADQGHIRKHPRPARAESNA